jgi:ATP-dependent exoDNAse (exonuclease V) alpha subunit
MISNKKHGNTSNAKFGEGDLLGDLIKFDRKGKFIFVGDPAQLPPIAQKESPALDKSALQQYFPTQNIEEYSLTEILRQKDDNDILLCASKLRNTGEKIKNVTIQNANTPKGHPRAANRQNIFNQSKFIPLPLSGYNSVCYMSPIRLLNDYIEKVKQQGFEKISFICHSNKECNAMGLYIREQLFGKQNILVEGDLLLVTQNNYIVDLVNGDLCVVKSVENKVKRAGLTFAKVTIEELAGKQSFSLLLVEDLIQNGQINLNEQQHNNLMADFIMRMKSRNIEVYTNKNKKILNPEFKMMLQRDPYMNALRAVYGYALTCHKSQGGEWNEIYLYLGKSLYALRESQLFQWAYTAITRAKEKIYYSGESYIFK